MVVIRKLHGYTLGPLKCSQCEATDLQPIDREIRREKDSRELQAMLKYTYYRCPAGHIVAD